MPRSPAFACKFPDANRDNGRQYDPAQLLEAPEAVLNELGVHVLGTLRRDAADVDLQRHLIPLRDSTGTVRAHVLAVPFLRQADLPGLQLGATGGAESAVTTAVRALHLAMSDAAETQAGGLPIIAMGHLTCSGEHTIAEMRRFQQPNAVRVSMQDGKLSIVGTRMGDGEYPTILPAHLPPVRIYRQPIEHAVADELHASVKHGVTNTRLKDLYDLYVFCTRCAIDEDRLRRGFGKWRQLYGTAVPASFDDIAAFGSAYAAMNARAWDALRKGAGWRVAAPELAEVIDTIRTAFEPAMAAAARSVGRRP